MGTHSVESQEQRSESCLEISQPSSPRPATSPLPRPLLVLWNLTTSTVVSMLVTGTPTRTSLRSLTPSSRNTMESLPTLSTSPTWTLRRSREILNREYQSTPPVSVLDVTLTDLVFPPELPSSRELMLKS